MILSHASITTNSRALEAVDSSGSLQKVFFRRSPLLVVVVFESLCGKMVMMGILMMVMMMMMMMMVMTITTMTASSPRKNAGRFCMVTGSHDALENMTSPVGHARHIKRRAPSDVSVRTRRVHEG